MNGDFAAGHIGREYRSSGLKNKHTANAEKVNKNGLDAF